MSLAKSQGGVVALYFICLTVPCFKCKLTGSLNKKRKWTLCNVNTLKHNYQADLQQCDQKEPDLHKLALLKMCATLQKAI